MKIQTGSPQSTIAHQAADGRAEATGPGAKRQKATAKPLKNGDTVELSGSLDTELKNRQAEQAKRVESIKALVKSGKYQVSSHDVAEKILHGTAGK